MLTHVIILALYYNMIIFIELKSMALTYRIKENKHISV